MYYSLIILLYYHQFLLLHATSASSLLFTLNNVRYSLSDRVLTIPKLGALRGIYIDYDNEYYEKYNLVNIEAYLGIQYGLYHGRFEPSKERIDLHPNTKVNKHIEFGPACSQYIWKNESELSRIRTKNFAQEYYPKLLKYILKQNEEQCLYMNIYQPQIKNLKERLPVLLFIHGDGYDMSTGAAFDGAIFASYTKTIVVTINYRLGPFGFLYISKENKGDYALQDIYTALHWLKNYVTNFNGDPDRITLYGTGSGAVLASLVVMLETVNGGTGIIKRRKPLVHRLILNEQLFLSPYMTSTLEDISIYQTNILSHLSCSTLSCLRNKNLITTNDFLQLNTYSDDNRHMNYICPLENPFPFYSNLLINNDHKNLLRLKFFQQAHLLLSENLHILLITSSTIIRKKLPIQIDMKNSIMNNIIEYLLNYAYIQWNKTSNQFDFDEQSLSYHQQIIAPLLQYAKYISNERKIYALERYSNKFNSELPFTFGYVLAPSMSVYNDTYLNADENDKIESMYIMDLFANLIHNGDINIKSPYCKRIECETFEEWHPILPELNFITLKDGQLSQQSGHYAHVHYLFNNLISNLLNQPLHLDLLNTWRTLYEVSHKSNTSIYNSIINHSTLKSKPIHFEIKNLRYVFVLALSILILLLLNFSVCIYLARRGHGCRKREYNCLNGHAPINIEKAPQHCGSSPSSTNSNGTITQQLIVNTNCITTNSTLSNTPPADILHPINITKKNGILRSSSIKKTVLLPEAIV
ncbi:unnamed protein product [Rotaria sp. Silwood1]|nr:unnamed protein product [Rotaria sp. Silwood1]CAF1636078.1 unnamed protein product [Rotaria sp. Silwood1]CAF3744088.1 unnamed protein product [Rotaria sp. Silwood1]CAF3791458.1 unnamed protein product [Rotaria sp. Silwood1]CAF3865678.1 unnamed protein product [Rotaria sp. Silwood1]